VNPIDREPESSTGEFLRGPGSSTQAVHTASDIPLTSFSSGSDAWRDFVGVLDNTDVFFKILKATGKRQ
jgi:alkaline phosphatase